MNRGGIFYGAGGFIGVAGALTGIFLGIFANNFFVALQTWISAAILTLVFVFLGSVLDSLDKISNQLSALKEEKNLPYTGASAPGSIAAAPIFQDHRQTKPAAPGTNEWACPQCGKVNQNYVGTCGCGEEKP